MVTPDTDQFSDPHHNFFLKVRHIYKLCDHPITGFGYFSHTHLVKEE